MKNVILLDLDGVLITTPPWKQDELHDDGYSNFNYLAVDNLNKLLSIADAELWLISDRRKGYIKEQFNAIFSNRNISKKLSGMVPVYPGEYTRIGELEKFLEEFTPTNFLSIDDEGSLEELEDDKKKFWVRTNPLVGFNEEKLNEAIEKIKNWKTCDTL